MAMGEEKGDSWATTNIRLCLRRRGIQGKGGPCFIKVDLRSVSSVVSHRWCIFGRLTCLHVMYETLFYACAVLGYIQRLLGIAGG